MTPCLNNRGAATLKRLFTDLRVFFARYMAVGNGATVSSDAQVSHHRHVSQRPLVGREGVVGYALVGRY
jgi:hypothetical protein